MKPLLNIQTVSVVLLLATSILIGSVDSAAPLPPLPVILEKAVERAKFEDQNDRGLQEHYAYKRLKVTEERSPQGKVRKRNQRISPHVPMEQSTTPVSTAAPANAAESDIRKGPLNKKDFSFDREMLSRFRFTLVGREVVNGRPALVLDFKPAGNNVPVRNLKDRVVNKAAGRLWLDEKEFVLIKADLHLTEGLSIAAGFVGTVKSFWYELARQRTPDGFWFRHAVHWHAEVREFLAQKIIDYEESGFDLRKVR